MKRRKTSPIRHKCGLTASWLTAIRMLHIPAAVTLCTVYVVHKVDD
jgi:hypothetical protein